MFVEFNWQRAVHRKKPLERAGCFVYSDFRISKHVEIRISEYAIIFPTNFQAVLAARRIGRGPRLRPVAALRPRVVSYA